MFTLSLHADTLYFRGFLSVSKTVNNDSVVKEGCGPRLYRPCLQQEMHLSLKAGSLYLMLNLLEWRVVC